MSCIYGWWNLNGAPIPPSTWNKITKDTSWWNPSSESELLDNNIGLGYLHTNISSYDDEGVQANTLLTKHNCTIVADTRLDNRSELLKKINTRDLTISDGEIILLAYLKFGNQCLDLFIGAFTFVIWDQRKKEIFAARDHIGIKTLNYYFENNQFIFGTQRKSILSVNTINKKADWDFIVKKINMRMNVEDQTENLCIKKLLPAHYLTVSSNGIQTKRYWNLDIESETKYSTTQDYVDHFIELFQNSIKARLRGSSRISAHLSGGLDSSGIAAVATKVAEHQKKEFHSFSYTFPDKENLKTPRGLFNFNPLVKEQIEFSGIKHAHLVDQRSKTTFISNIELETKVCDGISWSNNVRTEYEIQEQGKSNQIGINFSGFLGDEIITSFCRPYYLEYLGKGQYSKFFQNINNQKYGKFPLFMLFSSLRIMDNIGIPLNKGYFAKVYHNQMTKRQKKNISIDTSLFTEDFINSNKDLQLALQDNNKPDIHYTIPLTFKEYQRNHINRKWTSRRIESENLAALNFNMEYRYPMSDIRLLQYVLSVPIEQKRNDQHSRLLYRNAMKGYLTENIRWSKKFNSHLKPLAYFYKIKGDQSAQRFWNNMETNEILNIMDMQQIKDNLKYNREIRKLRPYTILAQLHKEGKIDF